MPQQHLFGFLTFFTAIRSTATPCKIFDAFKIYDAFFCSFFLQKGHSRHDMKMNNPLKGLSSGPVSNINRKQKHNMGLILTGNRHKQQVWEEECDFSYDVTGNLFVTWNYMGSWVGLKWVVWDDEGALTQVFPNDAPSGPGLREFGGTVGRTLKRRPCYSGGFNTVSCLCPRPSQWDDEHSDVIAWAQSFVGKPPAALLQDASRPHQQVLGCQGVPVPHRAQENSHYCCEKHCNLGQEQTHTL